MSHYIINSVLRALRLVLSCDLLKDRRIDDDSARFKFESCVILRTNHNSLLSIATNQFAYALWKKNKLAIISFSPNKFYAPFLASYKASKGLICTYGHRRLG